MKAPRRFEPPRLHTRTPRGYHRFYALTIWKGRHGLRAQQLQREPLCQACLLAGRTTPATDVDHVRPHRGDWDLFIAPSNHQSLCHSCHSIKTKRGA